MTAVQTSYSATLAAGLEGQIASMSPSVVSTRIVEGSGGIPFGRAVTEGIAYDRGAILAQSGSPDGAFVGISVRDVTLAAGDEDVYAEGANMGVLEVGDIWVKTVGAAAVHGNNASYNATTGTLGSSGTAITNSRWMTSGADGDMCILRLTRVTDGA